MKLQCQDFEEAQKVAIGAAKTYGLSKRYLENGTWIVEFDPKEWHEEQTA